MVPYSTHLLFLYASGYYNSSALRLKNKWSLKGYDYPVKEMCSSLCHCQIWEQAETVAVYSCTATVLILYLGSKNTSISDLRKVLENSGINRCDSENQMWSCKSKNEILRVLLFVGLFFSFLTKPWRLRCWLVVGESRQDIIAIATILSVNTALRGQCCRWI